MNISLSALKKSRKAPGIVEVERYLPIKPYQGCNQGMAGNYELIFMFPFAGIRSVSFKGDIVTIGTGSGMIYFYDLRAGKYLEMNCGHHLALEVGKGWLVSILHFPTSLCFGFPEFSSTFQIGQIFVSFSICKTGKS